MKTYTICGSMRFAEDMKKIAYDLEISKGYNILQCVYCEDNIVEYRKLNNSGKEVSNVRIRIPE